MKQIWSRTTIAVIITNLVVMLFLLLNISKLPPVVPLFFGNPTGESQLAPTKALFFPSITVLVVILLNRVLSYFLKDSFVDQILVWITVVLTILSVVTTLKIMYLVGMF